jgi:hypothetical protein
MIARKQKESQICMSILYFVAIHRCYYHVPNVNVAPELETVELRSSSSRVLRNILSTFQVAQ